MRSLYIRDTTFDPFRAGCEDIEHPLSGIGLDPALGLDEFSCTDYANIFGVGNGNCNVETIQASAHCDEGCQENPGFIQTRCPATCGTCGLARPYLEVAAAADANAILPTALHISLVVLCTKYTLRHQDGVNVHG